MMNYLFDDFHRDKRSKFPLIDQLYYFVLNKIFSYQVIPGVAFPTSQELATKLSLPEAVITQLYDRLLEERYVVRTNDRIMVFVSTHPSYLPLKQVLDVEKFFEVHGLTPLETLIKGVKPPMVKQIQQWMLITKPADMNRMLHRVLHTKVLNIFYSAISMNPDYLPVQCDRCDDITFLLEHWGTFKETSFTTMVLFSINLPAFLAEQFHVLEGMSSFAVRSSLLDQNGHMMATFLYVFSPRVFFNTKFTIQA